MLISIHEDLRNWMSATAPSRRTFSDILSHFVSTRDLKISPIFKNNSGILGIDSLYCSANGDDTTRKHAEDWKLFRSVNWEAELVRFGENACVKLSPQGNRWRWLWIET